MAYTKSGSFSARASVYARRKGCLLAKRGKKKRHEMTTREACDFLGISFKTLGYLHWKALNPEKTRPDQQVEWMPEPIKGSRWTETGVYDRDDIVELDHRLDAATPKGRKEK